MTPLTESGFANWLDGYGRASVDHDARAASELFSPDARYYETPFADPLIGREAIYRYWSAAAQASTEVQFAYQILAVSRTVGVARWQARMGRRSGKLTLLDGVLAAEFDEQGLCSLFREWWHRQEIEAGAEER